jgi:hypothetical protein
VALRHRPQPTPARAKNALDFGEAQFTPQPGMQERQTMTIDPILWNDWHPVAARCTLHAGRPHRTVLLHVPLMVTIQLPT